MGQDLVLHFGGTHEVVYAGIYRVLDAGFFLGFFSIVPAIQSAYEITSNSAETLKFAFVKVFGMSIEIIVSLVLASFL